MLVNYYTIVITLDAFLFFKVLQHVLSKCQKNLTGATVEGLLPFSLPRVGHPGEWLIGHSGEWLVGHSSDSVEWLRDHSGEWLIDHSSEWLIGHSGERLVGYSGEWLLGYSGEWLIGHSGEWLIGHSGEWLCSSVKLENDLLVQRNKRSHGAGEYISAKK